MAEAFFNQMAEGRGVAYSAGTNPAEEVDPNVCKVMLELGIDINGKKPRKLETDMLKNVYRNITMGCGVSEACPAGFIISEDWDLEDPKGKSLDGIRAIRDEIKKRVKDLVREL